MAPLTAPPFLTDLIQTLGHPRAAPHPGRKGAEDLRLRRSYTLRMQLRNARVCLDCGDVHDVEHCPVCASESFAYLTRWVPAPERRQKPRSTVPPPETLDSYRQLLSTDSNDAGRWRMVRSGAVGLALFGVAGWMWGRKGRGDDASAAPSDEARNGRDTP